MDTIAVIRASTKVSVVADEPTRWNRAVDRLTIKVICRTSQWSVERRRYCQLDQRWSSLLLSVQLCWHVPTICVPWRNFLRLWQRSRGKYLHSGSRYEPSVLWRCRLGGRKDFRPVKTEQWGAGVVICLERGADLHMARLMPLPLTVSCSRLVLPFWYQITRVVLDKEPFYVCVCVWQQTWRCTESSLIQIGLSTSTWSRTHWPLFLIPYPNFPATQRTAGQKQSPCSSFNVMIEHQPDT